MINYQETYRQHLAEAKEAAFARWQASGYRDLAAHAEFIRLWVAMISYATRVRRAA